jgi:hypothetical protein
MGVSLSSFFKITVFDFAGIFLKGKKSLNASRNKAAIKLLAPAITMGFQSTSLIKRPEVLHRIAQRKIAPCPARRCSL